MAKQNQKPAPAKVEQPAATTVANDNIMEEIRNKNIGEASMVKIAQQQIKDEQDKRLIEDKKRKISEAMYINAKARLMLRARRREEAATKDYLTKTKELLDELTGTVNEKGETVKEPTLTIFQYEDKRREITKEKDKAFAESDRQFREELKELRYQFPSYYCYEWDN